MIRTTKLTLKYATAKKQGVINALLQAYRTAVNFYIKSLWNNPGSLDKETRERLRLKHTRLSQEHRGEALRQALRMIISIKRAAKKRKILAVCPVFRGMCSFNSPHLIKIEEGRGSFDLIIRLSSLQKYKRIIIPTKKTKVFNKWISKPGAKLLQICRLTEAGIVLAIDIPDQKPKQGEILGIDIGVNKLVSDSNGNHYGTDFKNLKDKINRKQRKSKAKQRAIAERKNFIGRVTNQLPWKQLSLIIHEDLTNLKKGKKKNRSKAFRKALIPWSYRQVIEAIKNKAQEHRVDLKAVSPAYTSQTCPSCGKVSKDNRKLEKFCCIDCGYRNDADTVGAINILAKGLQLVGSLKSPTLKKASGG